jgi:hypothetical protein
MIGRSIHDVPLDISVKKEIKLLFHCGSYSWQNKDQVSVKEIKLLTRKAGTGSGTAKIVSVKKGLKLLYHMP